MGRIKTKLIKRISLELFNRFNDQIKTDFEENKKIIEQYTDITSKKTRNIIAGYLTRLKKQQSKR